MFTLYKKEITLFFSSLMGYIIIGVFLLFNGLFAWLFPETSILDYGYATLFTLFDKSPWLLLFLIPAITMRSFAEEKRNGTIELLITRPVTDIQIILAKFLAAVSLFLICLLPTLLYYYSVYQLASPIGNVDHGAMIGSYIGLFLLGSVFTAIGIFSSSLTSNQVVAFVLAIALCFFLYIGFDFVSKLSGIFGKADYYVEQIGINAHYTAMSYGVIDSRDFLYFISVIGFFLLLTLTSLQSRKW
jgi:ABC-2 type transport system permease protein